MTDENPRVLDMDVYFHMTGEIKVNRTVDILFHMTDEIIVQMTVEF